MTDATGVLQTWPKWPVYGNREYEAVNRVIRSNQLFAANEVKTFENDFKHYIGTNHAIGVGNATQGLHLALAALNVGTGDEVIVTNCSWISSASCILMQNAIPVFVDIESESFGLNPELLESSISDRTKAIIDVNILGYPSRIDEISRIANRFNIPLIEDASHGPGSKLNNKMIGSFGSISVFSLQQRKAISTGDGGIICTDNESIAENLVKLRSFGSNQLSYNYRMSEFSAALGRLGLEKLEKENEARRQSAKTLAELLNQYDWVKVRIAPENSVGVYYAIAIELNLPDLQCLAIIDEFARLGVAVRKLFSPLNKHPNFNPSEDVARGLPWKDRDYDGKMKNVDYSHLNFPVSEEYCNGRVMELYAHPGTTFEHLNAFKNKLIELYMIHTSNEDKKRNKWINEQ